MLKPRFLALAAHILLSLSGACATDNAPPGGTIAGSAARGGSGGKGGGAGKPSNPGGAGGTDRDSSVSEDAGGGGRAGSVGRAGAGGRSGSGGAGNAAGGGAPDASDELFDPDVLQRFDITLPPASITALNTNAELYTHAELKYGNTTLADVGIRIKGESSRRTLVQKAAFKIKFDEYVANQTLLGLKRLTLNNMLADATFMSECLSYYFYRAAQVPAPRCNHALVYVNGEFYGVYANIESEDKTFLKRWFASNDGNLYEDGMADFVAGSEQDFDLQTNETTNNRSDLTTLISAIDSAQSATFLADLEPILDTAHFLRFSAVEAAVDQWDGYSYTYYEPNNFRVYHDLSTGKFSFLPWGHDLAMKAFPIYDDTTPKPPPREFIPLFKAPLYENQTGARDAGGRIFFGDRNPQQRAEGGCLGSTTCKSEYAGVVREVIALYDDAQLATLAAKMYAQIRSHVLEDTRKEVSDAEFESAYQALLQHIAARTQAMSDDLSAEGFAP